jgi:HPt (histidine-containing phosphotransfer) domain-containing protein
MTGAAAPNPLARAEALFLSLAESRLALLEAARARLLAGQAPHDALTEIGGLAHKIAGTAATLGYADMGRTAAEVERLVALGATAPEVLPELERLLDALAGLAEA